MNATYVTRAATPRDVESIVAYLVDHVSDKGVGDTALFMPLDRGAPLPPSILQRFGNGLGVPVGEPGWMRMWLAFAGDTIVAHCDLAGPARRAASHRANLGMGVDRDHRQRGLGRTLMQQALTWAQAEASLRWVDLDVLGTNQVALGLYQASGFEQLARIDDAFTVDGESVARIMMTRRVD